MSAFRSIMVWLGLSSPATSPSTDAEYFLPAYERTRLLADGQPNRLDAQPADPYLAPPYADDTLLAGTQPTHYLEPS